MYKLIIIGLILTIININPFFAQQIPNSDFELWTNSNIAENWTTYIKVEGINIYTASRSNDANTGNYAAKLETKTLITGDVVPGMIQLGQMNVNTAEPYGGYPYTSKPTALSVNLKYDQQGGDSLIIMCYLSKYSKNESKSIILGGTFYSYAQPVEEYTTFLTPIYYLEEGEPDTINIFFSSSYKSAHSGSTLWVDDIEIMYGDYLLPPLAKDPENIKDTSFTATWTGADFTNSYILDVASDIDFNYKIAGYNDINVGDTNKFNVVVQDTSIKKIFYRLKADYDSIITDYSNIISFSLPYAPVCYEATNITHKSFTAKWQHLTTADYYILDVATDSLFQNFFQNYYYFTLDTNLFVVGDLQPMTDYYYRVRARYFISEKSKFSNVIKVTTIEKPEDFELKILSLPQKLAFVTDSTFLNAEIIMYSATGQIHSRCFMKTNYTEIETPSKEIFIIQITKENGEIIRKKIGVVSE